MNKVITFIKEARAELMKVNWLNRKQTINYTMLVVFISLAVAIFLGGLDYFFGFVLKEIIIK